MILILVHFGIPVGTGVGLSPPRLSECLLISPDMKGMYRAKAWSIHGHEFPGKPG